MKIDRTNLVIAISISAFIMFIMAVCIFIIFPLAEDYDPWSTLPTTPGAFDDVAERYNETVYMSDGTYSATPIYSYYNEETRRGQWFLVSVTDGYLFYTKPEASSEDSSPTISPKVRLLRDGETINGIGRINFEMIDETSELQNNVVPIEFLMTEFPAFAKLLDKQWVKNTYEDSDFRPMKLVFSRDMTYFSEHANGCSHSAPYMFYSDNPDEISFTLEEYNFCDVRRETGGSLNSSGLSFEITDTELITEPYTYNGYTVSD